MLADVEQNESLLEYAIPEQKVDHKIVPAVVEQNESLLKYAVPEHKADHESVLVDVN